MTSFEATDPHALAAALEEAWATPGGGSIEPEREAAARAAYEVEIARFAQRFLDLAHGRP